MIKPIVSVSPLTAKSKDIVSLVVLSDFKVTSPLLTSPKLQPVNTKPIAKRPMNKKLLKYFHTCPPNLIYLSIHQ